MKAKIISVTVGLSAAVFAVEPVILAGWNGAQNMQNKDRISADVSASGISAELIWGEDGAWIVSDAGSDDLTFGTFPGAEESTKVANGAVLCKKANAVLKVAVKNESAVNYVVESFHFDAWRPYGGGVASYRVRILEGALTKTHSLGAGDFSIQKQVPQKGRPDYQDIDLSLSQFEDAVLEAGASVVFQIEMVDERPNAGDLYIDNIAVTGRSE